MKATPGRRVSLLLGTRDAFVERILRGLGEGGGSIGEMVVGVPGRTS